MKKNKKKALLMTVLALFVLLNAGLLFWLQAKNEMRKQQKRDQDADVITVWTKDSHDAEFWMRKVEEFNRTNEDGITVRYEVFSDNYNQVVKNALRTKEAPDLLVYTQAVFQSMQDNYADITPYMDEAFREEFSHAFVNGVNVIDGACYYVPTGSSVARLCYNKEVFREAGITAPPETMEELIETARVITDKLSSKGIYGFALNLKSADSAFNRSLYKQGTMQLGLKVGYDFELGKYTFEEYQSLIEAWRTLMSDECAYPYCESLDIGPLRQMFAEGRIGMYMSYTHSEIGAYKAYPEMEGNWGCAALPTQDHVILGAENYSLNNGYLLNADSKNLEKAWTVYRSVFANMENLTEYYAEGYGVTFIPEIQKAIGKTAVLQENSLFYAGPTDRIWPLTPLERSSQDIFIDGIKDSELIKALILGNGDIEGELRDLSDRYNEAYQKNAEKGIIPYVRDAEFDPLSPVVSGAGDD